jgi:hypothetical protein
LLDLPFGRQYRAGRGEESFGMRISKRVERQIVFLRGTGARKEVKKR